MTDSAISAAVIPSQEANSESDLDYGDLEPVAVQGAQDSASLGRSLTTSQADYVKFPGFSSTRSQQRDPEGHHQPRSHLKPATTTKATHFRRWMKRSRSVDSLDNPPDLGRVVSRDQTTTPPLSEILRMNQLTREQQRASRSHRAAARSQGQDEEYARQQQARQNANDIQDLREGGSTNLEESPNRKEHQPQP